MPISTVLVSCAFIRPMVSPESVTDRAFVDPSGTNDTVGLLVTVDVRIVYS